MRFFLLSYVHFIFASCPLLLRIITFSVCVCVCVRMCVCVVFCLFLVDGGSVRSFFLLVLSCALWKFELSSALFLLSTLFMYILLHFSFDIFIFVLLNLLYLIFMPCLLFWLLLSCSGFFWLLSYVSVNID